MALAILNELGQNFHFLARQWPEKRIQKFKSRVADLGNNCTRRTPIQTVVTSTFAETRQEGGFEFTEFYSAA